MHNLNCFTNLVRYQKRLFLLFLFFNHLLIYLCMYQGVYCVGLGYVAVCMWRTADSFRVCSVLLPCEFWGCQASSKLCYLLSHRRSLWLFVCVYVCVSLYVYHAHMSDIQGHNRVSDGLGLELKVVVRSTRWVRGLTLLSSTGITRALYFLAIFLAT